MKNIWVLLFICFLFPVYALDLEFEAIAFMDYYGGIEAEDGYENIRSRLFFRPTLQGYHNNTGLEFHLSADLYYQPIGEPLFINPWEILHEAYFFLPLGNWDISLGQKYVSYGHSDIYSAFNRINSQNRTLLSMDDPYRARRSDLMLHLAYYPTFEDSFELIYVPIPRGDKEQDEEVSLNHANWDVQVDVSGQEYLTDNLHSFYFIYNHYGPNWDIQGFYGYYTNQTPDFDLTKLAEIDTQTVQGRVSLEYNRIHTLGMAYTTQFGPVAFSQEVGLNLTEDTDGTDLGIRNSDISVNTQFQGVLPGGFLSQLMIVYQHILFQPEADTGLSSANQEFLEEQVYGFHTQPQHNIAFMVGHTEKNFLRDRLKTALNVGFFFSPNVLLQPKVSFAFTDNMQFITGGDYTIGDPPSLQLRRTPVNDNYYVRLEYRY